MKLDKTAEKGFSVFIFNNWNYPTRFALWILSRAMKKDPGYAWSWHCNIAMVAQDAGAAQKEANERTADFMKRAFDVDTNFYT